MFNRQFVLLDDVTGIPLTVETDESVTTLSFKSSSLAFVFNLFSQFESKVLPL